jgi:hypothetical protein
MVGDEPNAQTGSSFHRRHLGASRVGCDPRDLFSLGREIHQLEYVSAGGGEQRIAPRFA